jgi:hypothetical protein
MMNSEIMARGRITYINLQIHSAALEESGCSAWQLEDEDQEDSSIVRLYYTCHAAIMAKVYMLAANGLHMCNLERKVHA